MQGDFSLRPVFTIVSYEDREEIVNGSKKETYVVYIMKVVQGKHEYSVRNFFSCSQSL